MNLFNGAIGGEIGGLIGAVVWAVVAYFLKVEVGYIAWAIGGLVGFGSAIGTKGGSAASGVIAVIITIVAICAGKYIAIYLMLSGGAAALSASSAELNDEFCTSLIADEICSAKLQRGEAIDWPPMANREVPEKRSDYPPEIWNDAAAQWRAMDPADRQQLKEAYAQNINQAMQGMQGQLTFQAFVSSFGIVDIIFFLLAIATAWRLAAHDAASGEGVAPTEQA